MSHLASFSPVLDRWGQPGHWWFQLAAAGSKGDNLRRRVRGLGFISGAGIDSALAGTASNQMYHISDWLPTIVAGVARLPLNLSRPGMPPPPALGEKMPIASFGASDVSVSLFSSLQLVLLSRRNQMASMFGQACPKASLHLVQRCC